jgi:poly(A) polymerase
VLRFFRFFAWYGSGRPEAEGLKACAAAKGELSGLSAERVWGETKKLLSAPDPGRALLWMRQSGVLTEVLPETEKWGIDAIPALVRTEGAFGWEPDPLLRLASIVPPDAERLAALGQRLRFSRAEISRLKNWATAPTVAYDMKDADFDRLLYACDRTAIIDRLKLQLSSARARAISDSKGMVEAAGFSKLLNRAMKWQKPAFPVTGDDLVASGIEPGPAVGEARRRLESLWIDSHFRLGREALLEKLEKEE